MGMYDRILLPIDTESGIERATEHAIDAAQRYDAALHVLYVVDSDTYRSYPGDEYVHEFEGLENALEQAGEEAVETVTRRAKNAGVETTGVVVNGVPHTEILEYADEAEIGLIVIGSKNRSGEYRRLLGSVADRVVQLTDRPVTLVKTPVSTGEKPT